MVLLWWQASTVTWHRCSPPWQLFCLWYYVCHTFCRISEAMPVPKSAPIITYYYGLLVLPYAGSSLWFEAVSFSFTISGALPRCFNNVWYQLCKVLVMIIWMYNFYFQCCGMTSKKVVKPKQKFCAGVDNAFALWISVLCEITWTLVPDRSSWATFRRWMKVERPSTWLPKIHVYWKGDSSEPFMLIIGLRPDEMIHLFVFLCVTS